MRVITSTPNRRDDVDDDGFPIGQPIDSLLIGSETIATAIVLNPMLALHGLTWLGLATLANWPAAKTRPGELGLSSEQTPTWLVK